MWSLYPQGTQGQATLALAQLGKDGLGKDLVVGMLTLCFPFLGPQERERVWDTYSGLEQELSTLRETLEYLLHLGSPQVHPCHV